MKITRKKKRYPIIPHAGNHEEFRLWNKQLSGDPGEMEDQGLLSACRLRCERIK